MDPLSGMLLALAKFGAPWMMAAAFGLLYVSERKQSSELSKKLYDLGTGMIAESRNTRHEIHETRRDIEVIRIAQQTVRAHAPPRRQED
jgi:hypothetical protein